jgi:hypothetical protein
MRFLPALRGFCWECSSVPFTKAARFWRLVERQPDEALVLFKGHPDCIVDPPAPPQSEYTGPFRFTTTEGVGHLVYIERTRIEAVQKMISSRLKLHEAAMR